MAFKLNSEIRRQRESLKNEILNSDLYGKNIYLLGTSEFGPTNEPMLVKSTTGLYNKFGRRGTLIDAFHSIKYCSTNNNVYLVKVTGSFATGYLNVNYENGDIIEDAFVFSSSESNEIFNDVKILIDTDCIKIFYPNDINIRDRVSAFYYEDYETIGKLSDAINDKTKRKNGYIYTSYTVDPSTPTATAFYCCNPDVIYLYGGQCGLDYSKNLLYNCLERTYSLLESYDIDIIVPVDAFIDDIYPDDSEEQEWQYNMKYYHSTKDYLTTDSSGRQKSFLNQIINFCAIQLNFGMVTTGIIGYNPTFDEYNEYLYESDDIVIMYRHSLEYNIHCCENPSYLFLISIVGGDIKYNQGTIIDNGYLAYAALCAETQIIQGTTNVPFNNSVAIYNEFSEDALKYLANSGIVSFRHSPFYNAVVSYDGITAYNNGGNGLGNFANVRMIQICISNLNKLFQFYIGQDIIRLVEEGILKDDISDILHVLFSKNVITDFSYEISPDYINGKLTLYLTLKTVYTTKAVKVCTVMEIATEE